MLNRYLVALGSMMALSVLPPAQARPTTMGSQNQASSSNSTQPPPPPGGQRRSPLEMLTQSLNLTTAQQTQISEILKNTTPGTTQDNAIQSVLTSDQVSKFKQILSQRPAPPSNSSATTSSNSTSTRSTSNSPPGY